MRIFDSVQNQDVTCCGNGLYCLQMFRITEQLHYITKLYRIGSGCQCVARVILVPKIGQ